MPYVVKDRVKVTSTTTGTGTFTLGAAVAGFQSFAAINPNSAWNVTTAVYSKSFSIAAQELTAQGLFFKSDGTKMYVSGSTGADINEYDLSTAWDISSAVYLQVFSIGFNPAALFFRSDGLKMYVTNGAGSTVNEYDLSSAWNISTASLLQSFSVATQDSAPNGLFFKSDGTKMYIVGNTNDRVYEYDLSSAWNISTASFLQNFSISAQDSSLSDLSFKSDGTKMYVLGNTNDSVYEYNLSSAWNISTASYYQSFVLSAQDTTPTGIFFKSNGSIMYVVGSTNDAVYQYNLGANQTYYCITNATDWEVGLGTVTDGGEILSRDTVLESSNSNSKVNWGAGSKDVFCTYPADATQGTVPTADNSSVGTDLYAWTNLKKQLDAGVVNGVPYANGNMSGMVSTFTLVSTGNSLYFGGVLASNGDIHFVPYSAARGQKLNYLTGTVSTYSLVYTGSGTYGGGVLAPNGDVHFVPFGVSIASRGQKISASGVVSTYSLVYTTTQAYFGGVLAPNGDIHFVPYQAVRGQKVSAAGVVSTYSLVYTAGTYSGGVLAPNGDIHFIPYTSKIGQKISAAGVVSTYSLVYTAGYYVGGVLASNGDIHFVPSWADVGQKVSQSGVVSTYSLVYTTTFACYGGVLAPNGDIHFIPASGVVGQKISAAGVVSTYSLIYTTTSAYYGGVLAPDGNIYFINDKATVGQKISTNTTRPIGYCLSPFFNKF